jgi:very-short-patch-repair endonuclease
MGAADVEVRIAKVAALQHGVVARGQLLAAGLTPDGIRSRLRSRRLDLLHRGVYMLGTLVGPLRPPRYREMAAVLACGRGAAVSHGSALWLWELLPVRPLGPVHVATAGARCRRPGIVAHRVGVVAGVDVAEVEGIPTTSVIRSILDFAGQATSRELERVIGRATRQAGLDLDELRVRLRLETGRPGVGRLRAVLARPVAFTRSPAEDGLADLVRAAGLQEPEWNVIVGGRERDAYWPDLDVAIEVDGFAHHNTRHAFEDDRDRDLDLAAGGTEVRRVTARQIRDEPLLVVRRLTAILTRAEIRRDATHKP